MKRLKFVRFVTKYVYTYGFFGMNHSVSVGPYSEPNALSFSHQYARFARSLPFWLTAFAIAAWSVAAAYINPAQFADSLEQFSWAHGLELGYWKHPPLPTWLIIAPIRLIGFSIYWTYALAAACFAGTAFFTWRITQRLFGPQAAVFAVLLIGLHIGFSWRAQLYNHNTVLILCVAATVWATLRALDSGKQSSWLLVGGLAGLAMLSKYQALVPLVGIVLALQLGGFSCIFAACDLGCYGQWLDN
jgi:4-amino-4-deoxy-L-arabinose transferase-like glycosyltransferase